MKGSQLPFHHVSSVGVRLFPKGRTRTITLRGPHDTCLLSKISGHFFVKVKPSPRHVLDDFLEKNVITLDDELSWHSPFLLSCLVADSLARKGMKVKLSKVFKSCSDAQSPGL